CASTRYPEAIPLRSIKAQAIVKAIVKFCTIFGVPRFIQSDRATNFMSKVFAKVIRKLNVKHQVSSAYHPQSQGAIERFHQTLKSMLRTFCVEQEKGWDEEIPLLLFAIRTTTQASLGFSPSELIFGHNVRGPLKILQEQILSSDHPSSTKNVLDHVSEFRERLFQLKAIQRSFRSGDLVLILLPVVGSVLHAKFAGPYEVKEKVSETDYVVNTPDRRRKTRLCHVNMLKLDEVKMNSAAFTSARLLNSETLSNLSSKLSHLPLSAQSDIRSVIEKYPSLFSDLPTTTHVLTHDIDVGSHSPVTQRSYRIKPVKRDLMRQETKYLLEHGFAVPSSSPWCSPCLLIPKQDGTSRFCKDYRKINALTKADSYPMTRMEDCVDRVGNAKFVTKLDLLKGYWQVPLTERASEISAFATPDVFLQYQVMPFGLRNAGATFQRMMSRVLSDVSNCEVYLDDVVCYDDSFEDHLRSIDKVFKCLSDANLNLNLSKCEFGCATVTYLGKEVGNGQVRPLN
ncbi:hypothetical protein IRJ41_019425, partial [Triplophysa rosa]